MKKNSIVSLMMLVASSGLSAQSAMTALWNQNPEPDIAGYRVLIDQTLYDVGNVTQWRTPVLAAGQHQAAVLAYNTAGLVSPFSSPPVLFTVQGPAPDPCASLPGGAPSIVVSSYTTPVTGGLEGTVTAKVLGPAPVTVMQVLLGTQVVGEIDGTELRFIRAIGFATPRTPGTYNLFVAAQDSRNCKTQTTLVRPLVIQ